MAHSPHGSKQWCTCFRGDTVIPATSNSMADTPRYTCLTGTAATYSTSISRFMALCADENSQHNLQLNSDANAATTSAAIHHVG